MYQVKLTARARRGLDKTGGEDAERITGALQGLGGNPRPPGVRKLRGPIHRLRVGDWRIIYAVFDKDRLVLVGRITQRSEDTYDRVKDLF
ncbi:type II toxin-antitoxin system RelE/ParE family toxin [Chloroflexota bacterium]